MKVRLTAQRQMSESFVVNALLAFSGGFQDAYTYVGRGQVFANAQTGNIVLMSTRALAGEWQKSIRYAVPVLAFLAGISAAERIRKRCAQAKRLHWRQLVVAAELAILAAAGCIPAPLDMLASVLISFACAMQVQSFRTVGGNAYASTMCIGNLRSSVLAYLAFRRHRQREELTKLYCYCGILLIFAVGAGIGGNVTKFIGIKSIFVAAVVLALVCLLLGCKSADNAGITEVHQ